MRRSRAVKVAKIDSKRPVEAVITRLLRVERPVCRHSTCPGIDAAGFFEGDSSPVIEQNESEKAASAGRQCNGARGQLAGFLVLRDLALTDFREDAGLMLSGRPAATGAIADSGSGLKKARQPGDSCDLFLIMQTVMRSTSGMSALQRRNASPLHACCCSGV